MGRPRLHAFDVATRERILDAAEVEFALYGLGGARLEAIARRAGIRAPSLFYYFQTKRVLYGSTVARAFAKLEGALSAAMLGPGSLGAHVEALTRVFENFLAEHRAIATLVLRELMDARGTGPHILTKQIVPLLNAVEDYLRREGAPRRVPLREAMMAIVSGGLLRAATPLRKEFWRKGDGGPRLARLLLTRG